MRVIISAPLGHPPGTSFEMVLLSKTEKETLRYVCLRLSTKEIACRWGKSPATVDEYIKRLCRGLKVSTRRDLMAWAWNQPQCWLPEIYVPRRSHSEGCGCPAIYCSAMRAAKVQSVGRGRRRPRAA